MALAVEVKKSVIRDFRTHDKDSGSPEVQVAVLTARINDLAQHLKGHPKDNHSRRGLITMVGKRNRLLRYLSRTNEDAYTGLIGRLGLRK